MSASVPPEVNIISEGEVLQLSLKSKEQISEDDYFEIIGRKTAELFKASSRSAAVLSKASHEEVESAGDFAYSLGIAFQIQDDLLDYFGNEKVTGKKIGKDFLEGKITIPLLRAIKLASEENKKTIFKLMEKKNSSDLLQIIEIIESSGALDGVQKTCDSYIDNCLTQLNFFPDSIYKTQLMSIVMDVKVRESGADYEDCLLYNKHILTK